ncbi:MAG: barstar family protein [Oscillospiraceae bacterium]|nr:barstar family protein [Oscillospiraceae bacterium]
MVKKYIIDCEKLSERRAAHRYLAETLEFPKYYGNNLDALFDCMTEKAECTILFKGAVELYKKGGYGARILEVMREAAAANPLLQMAMTENVPAQ